MVLAWAALAVGAGPSIARAELKPVKAGDAAWTRLAAEFAKQPEVFVNFSEQRFFPFRKEPVLLTGAVRITPDRGLSLQYRTPEWRIVIVDRSGVLVRDAKGESPAPTDPRATAINEALLNILRLDLAALDGAFEVMGEQNDRQWVLALIPRQEIVRQAVARIEVRGVGPTVTHIELRHSARQYISIDLSQPMPHAPFSRDDLRAFFR